MAKATADMTQDLLQGTEALVNTGERLWAGLDEAIVRVRAMPTKPRRWAVNDPDRLFDDVFNLVHDRDFLTVGQGQEPAATGHF